MTEVRARVREALRARLEAAARRNATAAARSREPGVAPAGATATDAASAAAAVDPALIDALEALFLEATTIDDPDALALPALLTEPWRPELALHITSHRGGWIGRTIVSAKRRLLLPLTRFLFEYTLGNFRRQDRLNLAMLACLERLAAENLRLQRELLAVRGLSAPAANPDADPDPGSGSGSGGGRPASA